MKAQLDNSYRPNEGVAERMVNDEMVIVDLREGVYHGLNPVGADVWRLLDGRKSLQEVVLEISQLYPDSALDVVEDDVVELVQALLDNELITANL